MTSNEHPVVVGVDGSQSALHATRWAATEAERRNAPLLLVHVCHALPEREVTPPADYQAALREQARHWLVEASEAARRAVPGLAVVTDLHEGNPADVLVAESRDAQLMVLGSRGLGGFTTLLVGSVAVALSAHGHCPVVVMHSAARDGAPPVDGPVVVGVDGSELSDAALTFAFEEAEARDVPLVAVHTWLDVNAAGAWAVLPNTIDWDWVQKQEEKLLADRLVAWREKFPHVEVRPIVERDRPDRALLTHAAGAQLLVVGCRGRNALTGMGLGSVSQTLIHHAECPVAVARRERP